MRKHLCYILLQLKSAFRYIPGLFAGTLLFGFLTFLTAFACLNSSDTQTKLFFKIAVVLPSDDTLVNLGFNMLTQMESLKDYCEFIQTDHATAETMLKKGEVYGIVYIPKGFVEDVLNGQNTPARIILPDNPGIETSLFRSVLNAGSDTLAYVQSGIYALSDTYNHFGLSDKIAAATDELNDYYIRFVVNRSSMYSIKTVSATGSLSGIQYYICSGIVIIITLSGFLLGSFITGESRQTESMLKRCGIGSIFTCACRIFAISISYSVLLIGIMFIGSLILPHAPGELSEEIEEISYSLLPYGALAVFLCVTIFAAFFYTVYTIAGNGLYGMLLVFCLDIVMIYGSGLIIPTAYLQKPFVIISRFFPAVYAKDIAAALYGQLPSVSSVCTGIGMIVFFILSSALIKKIKLRRL